MARGIKQSMAMSISMNPSSSVAAEHTESTVYTGSCDEMLAMNTLPAEPRRADGVRSSLKLSPFQGRGSPSISPLQPARREPCTESLRQAAQLVEKETLPQEQTQLGVVINLPVPKSDVCATDSPSACMDEETLAETSQEALSEQAVRHND